MKRWFLLLLVVALVAGCGSSNKSADTTTSVTKVLPNAATPDEWASRVVNILLRPLNNDLRVVSGFNNPQIRLFIESANPTTLNIINKRMKNLQRCTAKLDQIGPPPKGDARLQTINAKLHSACADYVTVANVLLKATPFLSSGRTDVIAKGTDMVVSVRDDSGRAANNLATAVRVAQDIPAFRRAGLKPSI
jgi:hypothetical protein